MSIKKEELRIGNLLLRPTVMPNGDVEDIIMPVGPMDIRDACFYGEDWNAKPIPLTSEWLERAGFDKNYGKHIKSIISLQRFVNYFSVRIHGKYTGRIEHVHDLQNLYFALTGTELTFK